VNWYNRPDSGRHTKWTQFHPTTKELKKKNETRAVAQSVVTSFHLVADQLQMLVGIVVDVM
jgi:hypothetical protein